jgi:hypothetical protein
LNGPNSSSSTREWSSSVYRWVGSGRFTVRSNLGLSSRWGKGGQECVPKRPFWDCRSAVRRRSRNGTATDIAAYRSGFGFLVADAIACERGLGIVGGMGCYRQESSFRRVAKPVG